MEEFSFGPKLHRKPSDEGSILLGRSGFWIESTFNRRECVLFVSSANDGSACECGREKVHHLYLKGNSIERWNPHTHSELMPTDAFGTIEFQGDPHLTKAQFVRLSYDSQPSQVLELLCDHWELQLPKLLISVQCDTEHLDLPRKQGIIFREGLLRAAKTTGAWFISSGMNTGVVRHVGRALGTTLQQARNQIVTIGVAPWGVLHNREELIGRNVVVPYRLTARTTSSSDVLNGNHAYFLLADNGMVGKYGGETGLRRNLEKCIQQQKVTTKSGPKNNHTPVVSLVLEGGTRTIHTVLECITDTPPMPVVVVDGSGRAADLLAFTHKYAIDDGTMADVHRDELLLKIERTFLYTREQSEKLFVELMQCVKNKELVTVLRLGEPSSPDIDLAILTALLKAQNASAPDQLSLVLAWNRVDIARNHIFTYGQEWPEGALDQAMMDALILDRVDFVQLLLENGVSMQHWLTIPHLEELYNMRDPPVTLKNLLMEVTRASLLSIGLVIEKLMGGAYQAAYCKRAFKRIYHAINKHIPSHSNLFDVSNVLMALPNTSGIVEYNFRYPFHELMIWAILMKRQNMAIFMWEHGEEALAKAIVACKMNLALAHEASQVDHEIDVKAELKGYASQFEHLALSLLDHCYKVDVDQTQRLLTCDLSYFSHQTCLSLAASAEIRDLVAHSSCQILLADMWLGGLRMKKYTTFTVIAGVIFFPLVLLLDFKSKEELQSMPQTEEEHLHDLNDSVSDESQQEQKQEGQSPLDVIRKDSNAIRNFNRRSMSAIAKRKRSTLKFGKKVYEFYMAPITKFWFHTIGYVVFLLFLSFTVLVNMAPQVSWHEAYAMSYVVTYCVELIRKIIITETKTPLKKLKVFFLRGWHITASIAVTLFIAGMAVRFSPIDDVYAKVLYTVTIPLWFTRLLDIVSVNKYLGVYVTMIGKMVKDMIRFVVFLLAVIMSFGIVRQALYFPYEKPSWNSVKAIFRKPYFMMYGELVADEIDPATCAPTGNCVPNVPGQWLVPVAMTLYLLSIIVLLLNLLVASFNNTFREVIAVTNTVWKYRRYELVIQYESKPFLPPPFIIVYHIFSIGKLIILQCNNRPAKFDNGLKLFLTPDEVEELHDFEEECMEELFTHRNDEENVQLGERIKTTKERMDNVHIHLENAAHRGAAASITIQTTHHRLTQIEEALLQATQCASRIQQSIMNILNTEVEPGIQYSSNRRIGLGSQLFPHRRFRKRQHIFPNMPPTLIVKSRKSPVKGCTNKAYKRATAQQSDSFYHKEHHKMRSRGTTREEAHRNQDCKTHRLTQDQPWAVPKPMLAPIMTPKLTNYKTMTDNIDTPGATSHKQLLPTATYRRMSNPENRFKHMTPKMIDYTTATDNIDTSHDSPKQSSLSATYRRMSNPENRFNLSDYTTITDSIDTSDFRPNQAPKQTHTDRRMSNPERKLKRVDESEKGALEQTLLKRMRQISLTESESLSTLAKIVVQDISSTDSGWNQERGYHSDGDNGNTCSQVLSGKDLHKVSTESSMYRLTPLTVDTETGESGDEDD